MSDETGESPPPPGRMGASVVILAGGRSSRFGSPKLEATLDGRPLLEHVVDLGLALSDDVVVTLPAVAGEGAPAQNRVRAMPSGVRTVRDAEAFGGPLVGLASALDVVDRSIVIGLGGDMPRLTVALLEPMLILLGSHPDVDAVVLELDGAPRPLPLVAHAAAAREAARAILVRGGERSLRAFLGTLRTRVIAEVHWRPLDPAGRALADVDRPGDLAALDSGGG